VQSGILSVLEVADQHRRGEEVIDRDVEETLDLRSVQVHGQDPVRPGGGDQVGDELRGDRNARLVLPVLTRVAVVRKHGRDPARRGPLERVEHDQKLDQVVVDGGAGRLKDEDVCAADVLVDLCVALAVREVVERDFARSDGQNLTHLAGEARMRAAGEDFEWSVHENQGGKRSVAAHYTHAGANGK
jgi:hypothetical protein